MSSRQQTFTLPTIPQGIVGDEQARKYYLVTIVLCLLSVAIASVVLSNLPQQIPIWFTYPWGEGRLAPRNFILVIPGIMTLVLITNIMIARLFRNYPILLSRILAIASMLFSIMLFMALIGILQSIL